MRCLTILSLFAFALVASCQMGSEPAAPAQQNAGYQQVCNPAMGALACQQGYFSQSRQQQVPLECFQHNNGAALCTYACTPGSLNECDAPSPKCNGKGRCADRGEHGQNNPNGG